MAGEKDHPDDTYLVTIDLSGDQKVMNFSQTDADDVSSRASTPLSPISERRLSTRQHGDNGDAGSSPGESTDGAPDGEEKLEKSKVFLVMPALCLALFLAALDMTIISTALPTMAASLHANESGYSWMASSYLLANASCVPLWGKFSDVWGRKPVLLIANFVFLIGSLICALATNLTMILVGRAVQGIGGGGIIVLANISVSDLFSVRDRPMYYGIFGAIWAIAGALGPIIGGAFTTSVSWRWCFWINLPVGGVSFIALLLFLRIESTKTPLMAGLRSIDWSGMILILGGTLMFLFGLEFGGVNFPWDSPTVICLIIFGVVVWALAMLNEWKIAKYPVIPPRLFKEWHNVCVLLICFCHSFVFVASTYYLPLYFQTVLLATPILSGVYNLPMILALSIFSTGTGFVIKKTGSYRPLIFFGFFFMTLGYGLFINLKPYADWPRIILFQIIAGAGVGPLFQSPLVAFQANVHPSDMATATATFAFIRQTASSMSVVLATVIYQNVLAEKINQLSSLLGPETTEKLATSFSASSKGLISSLPTDQKDAVMEALTFTFSRMWIFYAAIGAIGIVLSLFVRQVELSKKHTFTKTGLEEQERARQELLANERSESEKNGKAEV
ncbi:hypothetical protein MW887_002598 [Aspergillus wentii]|nr:hypothetical protein MW887_002598 [Aspergillus wentii]